MGFFSLKTRRVTSSRTAQAARNRPLRLESLEDRLVPTDFTNIDAMLNGVQARSLAWGDYNNDSHLDLVISGTASVSSNTAISQVYTGDGNGGFILDAKAILPGVVGSVAWGDYNNDGHLDFVICGQDNSGTLVTRVYQGDGSGGFTLDTNANLIGEDNGSVAWGDYNNDGHLDLVICGQDSNDMPITQVYSGDGNGGFTRDANALLPGVHTSATAAWGDYNSDGHLDLLICGLDSSSTPITQVYTGDGNGGFILDASAILLGPEQRGAAAWGDYNSDGHLDLAICDQDNSGTSMTQVFTGDGNGGFTLDVNAVLPAVDFSSMAWGDFNNDGHTDLAICGLSPVTGFRITQVYSGDGNGSFTLDANAVLSGNDAGSVEWGDYNNDGRLDLATSGDVGGQIFQNTSGAPANSAPTVPTGLTTSLPSSTSVTFSWNAATDSQTASAGLSYTLRVGTTPGGDEVVNPMSNLSTGQRLLSSFGLIQGTSYTLTGLTPGTTYYWSVQAVDSGLEGGAFANEQSVTLSGPGNQAPAITSATKTTFTVSSAGSFTVTATGSPTPTLSESGALPSGVSFNATTGILNGTPAPGTSGTYALTFTASNGVGTNATQNFTLTVGLAPVITSANSTTFTVGSAGSFTVTGTGFPPPVFSSSGALPSGVSFNSVTGILTGTPAAGTGRTYSLTFTASNGVGTNATQSFILTVNQSPAITSANKTTIPVDSAGSFTVTATGFPTPVLSESGALPTGVSFNAATGLLSGTPAPGTSGNYALTFTASNGVGTNATQNFTLTVGQAPAINSATNATFTVGSAGSFTVTATGFPTPTLSASGALPSGVSFNAATGVLGGLPALGTGGAYSLTFTASNGVGASATQNFTLIVDQSPTITSANKKTITVGSAASFTITATGFPIPALNETGALPSGVTFNAGNGILSGTPAAGTGGSYPLTFTASNGVGTDATQSFTLIVNQSSAITSANQTTFAVGSAGSFTVTATGFPTPVYSASGALPSGVTFNAGSGILGGAPAAGTSGTYPLTFTASNGVGANATQSFTLTVNQAAAITSTNQTTITVGNAGSFTVTATGSPTPALGEIGALPSGVAFNAGTGILSGTPAAGTGGIYPLTFTATNAVGTNSTQNFILTVNEASAITSTNQTTFTPGSAGSFTVVATGFPTPVLSTHGALPSGITFDAGTGILGGTPASGAGGTYPLTFTASNGVGSNVIQSFILTVDQSPVFISTNQTTFSLGAANRFTVLAAGFPTAALSTRGTLPTGVTFDSTTGILSGTPPAGTAGTYLLTFNAGNGLGSGATQSFTLTVHQTANQRYVEAIYQDLLGHEPDAVGLAYWSGLLDHGVSRTTILNLFDHGSWYFSPLIKSAYQQYLGRTPDSGGLVFWIQQMINGVTDEQLEASLIASAEYFQHAGGSNKRWIDAVYQDLLGRQPDSQGEQFWVGQLNIGMSRSAVAFGFAASNERERQHIMADYKKFLKRSAGSTEIDYWLGRFVHGSSNEDIITGLLASDEYYNKGA